MQRLTPTTAIEEMRRRIAALLDARAEWFCTETSIPPSVAVTTRSIANDARRLGASASSAGVTFALRRGEWEIEAAHGALLLSLLTERGMRHWRVAAWEQQCERLIFQTTRRMGGERATLEFIPRASASDTQSLVAAARRAASGHLAIVACRMLTGARPVRVGLSRGARRGEPGRYARIILQSTRERIALAAPLVELSAHETDAFLASTLLWHAHLGEATRAPRPLKLWLAVAHDISQATALRLSLLRDDLRRAISLYELNDSALLSIEKPDERHETTGARSETPTPDKHETLTPLDVPELDAALDSCAPRFHPPSEAATGRAAREIASLAPGAIDVVRARHGETLRFHGLAFARVRRVAGREQVWFGVEGASPRRLLDEENHAELLNLVAELSVHRRAGSDAPHHAFYKAAPEAWLETLLRRDISHLDPGLVVAPLHAQFRTARERHAGAGRPVDLLALRHDGRLVVIELKTSEDAALPLQGADYWRRVEAQRRHGRLARARLFGDAIIADQPPLVYLVAPLLRFHRAVNTLARDLNPRIEIFRFDINEDWRAGVRVSRRCDVNP